ncbi:hypothetical protein BJ944DRAFT_273668 [Cunninghamella echinulata]|nr:hypothetical protein BJ944DRAFT_273668 [Cunninghamella echinulata]
MNHTPHLLGLPNELVLYIFKQFLDLGDVWRLLQVSRQCRQFAIDTIQKRWKIDLVFNQDTIMKIQCRAALIALEQLSLQLSLHTRHGSISSLNTTTTMPSSFLSDYNHSHATTINHHNELIGSSALSITERPTRNNRNRSRPSSHHTTSLLLENENSIDMELSDDEDDDEVEDDDDDDDDDDMDMGQQHINLNQHDHLMSTSPNLIPPSPPSSSFIFTDTLPNPVLVDSNNSNNNNNSNQEYQGQADDDEDEDELEELEEEEEEDDMDLDLNNDNNSDEDIEQVDQDVSLEENNTTTNPHLLEDALATNQNNNNNNNITPTPTTIPSQQHHHDILLTSASNDNKLFHELMMKEERLHQRIIRGISSYKHKYVLIEDIDIRNRIRATVDVIFHHAVFVAALSRQPVRLACTHASSNNRALAAMMVRLLTRLDAAFQSYCREITYTLADNIKAFLEYTGYKLLAQPPSSSSVPSLYSFIFGPACYIHSSSYISSSTSSSTSNHHHHHLMIPFPSATIPTITSSTTSFNSIHPLHPLSSSSSSSSSSFYSSKSKSKSNSLIFTLHSISACFDLMGAAFVGKILGESHMECAVQRACELLTEERHLRMIRRALLVDLLEGWLTINRALVVGEFARLVRLVRLEIEKCDRLQQQQSSSSTSLSSFNFYHPPPPPPPLSHHHHHPTSTVNHHNSFLLHHQQHHHHHHHHLNDIHTNSNHLLSENHALYPSRPTSRYQIS